MNREEELRGFLELIRMHTKIYNILWNRTHQDGLSPSDLTMLELVNAAGRQKASSLANALYITTGGVTVISDKLVKAGLMRREKEEKDRRTVFLEITEAGRNALQELRQQRKQLQDELFCVLSDEEVGALSEIYGKLVRHGDKVMARGTNSLSP